MLAKVSLKTKQKAALISIGMMGTCSTDYAVAHVEPKVVLANEYRSDIQLDLYWMSEKLDGIRAIWTGEQLITRSGKMIHAPEWFINKLPGVAVEGELWAGRGQFNHVQTTVLDKVPDEQAWAQIRFMLFDLIEEKRSYKERYYELNQLVDASDIPWVSYVEHKETSSEAELLETLDSIIKIGGEGVMLRRFDSSYQAGRTGDLVKVKRHQDDEAKVIGYKPGTGKYEGLMGSVLVQTKDGRTLYIGSGFTDEMRRNPPALGDTITYRFNGYTKTGLPRFARFSRIRPE